MAEKDYSDEQEQIIIDDTSDESIPFEYTITSYGADYPVDLLVSRLKEKDIFVPRFQRQYIWPITEASRFIESLLLGLPVPGVFLSKETDTEKMLIIDGQQRLKTLQFFYEGIIRSKEFELKGVQKKYEGKTYKTLTPEDKRKLGDSIIHATIIKQDKPSEDNSSIYHIFERLNSSGIQLQPQEIRACIYHGDFNALLYELRENKYWKTIFGTTSIRLKDAELILRFFAFCFMREKYARPIKEFLNSYMGKNRNLKLQSKEELKSKFIPTVRLISESFGKDAFRPEGSLNAAVCEAVMVGVTKRLDKGEIVKVKQFKDQYNKLMKDKEFLLACKTGTSDEAKVNIRMDKAIKCFSSIE